MSNEPLTHSDRYVRKTNKIILIIGIICLFVFLFSLLLLSQPAEQEEQQHYEFEKTIDAETSIDAAPAADMSAEIEFDQTEETERPITMTPNPVNMGQVVIGNNAGNVLTIGTNGKRAIRILSVELEDAPFEGFTYESDCNNKELRGKITCTVIMNWLPTVAANVQNNFKIIWHETNVSESNAKHDEVSVYGSAVRKEDCNFCDSGMPTGIGSGFGKSDGGQEIGGNVRYAVGPDGKIIGIIDEDGIVHDANGNEIGRVNASGMIVDKDGNIIGVASTGKLVLDENGNVIGYVDANGIAHDNEGNVIGTMLSDGTVVDANGKVIGKSADYGYVYDNDGNLIGRVMADGSVVDLDGEIIGKLDKDGRVVDFNGNIIGRVAKSGEVVTDADGNQIGIVLPNGDVVDEDGNIVGKMGADGTVSTVQTIGKRGSTARLAIDKDGNVIGYVDDKGNVFDLSGNLIGHTDDNGNVIDENGNIIGRQSDEWRDLAIDENGNVIGYIDQEGMVHGAGGQIIGYVDENGNIIGNLLQRNIIGKADENGNVVQYISDDGQIIGSAGQQMELAVDENGNIVGYIDENSNVYDENGNVIDRVNEDGTIIDRDNNVIDHKGKKVNVAYDNDGKIIGYIDEKGVVRNKTNEIIGLIDAKGNVKSFGRKIVGGAINKDMLPITPSGRILGTINNRGEVISQQKVVGKMRPDGLVTDVGGGKILAKGVNPGYIADWGCDFSRKLDKDGIVRQDGTETDLKVYADGTVWDKEGHFKGQVISTGSVYDNECNYLGEAMADGYVRDVNGREIGCLNPDGTVLDIEEPRLKGHIVKPRVVISPTNWRSLGTLEANGTLRNANGEIIGCSNIYGDVYDKNMSYLGFVSQAVYAFKFDGKPLGKFDARGYLNSKEVSGAHLIFNNLLADKNQNIVGYALPEVNVVTDAQDNIVGRLFPDGIVYDDSGVIIDKFNGGNVGIYNGKALRFVRPLHVVDMSGRNVGKVNYDLSVVDYKGSVIGKVNAKGEMYDDGGRLIGGVVRQGAVRGYSGAYLGYVVSTGEVIQLDSSSVGEQVFKPGDVSGQVTPDGIVLKDHQIVGETLPQGIMADVHGNLAGMSNDRGFVISPTGNVLAVILPGGGNTGNFVPLQTGAVINFQGQLIGVVLPTGQFMDQKHVVAGRVLADGKVVSPNGDFLGEVVNGDIVIGGDDRLKGYVQFDGSVRKSGSEIGHILTDGLAMDKQMKILGHIFGIGNAVLSNSGEYIGRVSAGGRVIIGEDNEIGFIKSNGSFVDMDKNVSGYVLPEVARNRRN